MTEPWKIRPTPEERAQHDRIARSIKRRREEALVAAVDAFVQAYRPALEELSR